MNFKQICHLFAGYKIKLHQSRFSEEQEDTEFTIEWSSCKQFCIKETGIVYDWKYYRMSEVPMDLIVCRNLFTMTHKEVIEYFSLPEGSEILKKIDRGSSIEFQYRWVNKIPERNIKDGFSYSACAISNNCRMLNTTIDKFFYLIEKQFDVFGLIDREMALPA